MEENANGSVEEMDFSGYASPKPEVNPSNQQIIEVNEITEGGPIYVWTAKLLQVDSSAAHIVKIVLIAVAVGLIALAIISYFTFGTVETSAPMPLVPNPSPPPVQQ